MPSSPSSVRSVFGYLDGHIGSLVLTEQGRAMAQFLARAVSEAVVAGEVEFNGKGQALRLNVQRKLGRGPLTIFVAAIPRILGVGLTKFVVEAER